MKRGILIAADGEVEDLIPWWYDRLLEHSTLPVALVDLGMSAKMRAWCKKRMHVVPLNTYTSVSGKTLIDTQLQSHWERDYKGPLWKSRTAWFQKPAACLHSPFDFTLWLDLDCEVLGPLDSLFSMLSPHTDLLISLERFHHHKPPVYNSGVMLFRKNAPFLHTWHHRCHTENHRMMGDQDVLTSMIQQSTLVCQELSPLYNWVMYAGYHPGIVIAHWVSGWGKEYIRKYGGLKALLPYGSKAS